jgi:hypothetical protein
LKFFALKKRKPDYKNLLVIGLIICIGLFYNLKRLNNLPMHLHAWAQADRYALALGFMANGFDFFHPQTYVLNKQFPHNFAKPSENLVTAVDFPLNEYVVAFIMKIFGSQSPWCFRIYTLIVSFIGLFFLYKSAYAITQNFLVSVFILLFCATSPVYIYYQASFLPVIPALSLAMAGVYFILKYLKTNENRYFYPMVFLLSLASLIRSSFLLPFCTVVALEFYLNIKIKNVGPMKWLALLAGILVVFLYYAYNQYLAEKFGSMFLNHLMPPEQFLQLVEIFGQSISNWLFHYFSIYHYAVLVGLILATFIKKLRLDKTTNKTILIFLIIWFLACISFFIAMVQQFPDHDYYFLDTFYLPVAVLIMVLFSKFDWHQKPWKYFIFLFLAIFMIVSAKNTDNSRTAPALLDNTQTSIKNFLTAPVFFDLLDIGQDKVIMVADVHAPNLPFILMKRKGYNITGASAEVYKHAFSWNFDYVVVQNEFLLSVVTSKYPGFINHFKRIANNGYLSILQKSSYHPMVGIEIFLDINPSKVLFCDSIHFEGIQPATWQNTFSKTTDSVSMNKWGYFGAENEFGLTYKNSDLTFFNQKSCLIKFSGRFFSKVKNLSGCRLVVSLSAQGKLVFYQFIDLEGQIIPGAMEYKDFFFLLPIIQEKQLELGIYFWNTGKKELYYDDINLSVY